MVRWLGFEGPTGWLDIPPPPNPGNKLIYTCPQRLMEPRKKKANKWDFPSLTVWHRQVGKTESKHCCPPLSCCCHSLRGIGKRIDGWVECRVKIVGESAYEYNYVVPCIPSMAYLSRRIFSFIRSVNQQWLIKFSDYYAIIFTSGKVYRATGYFFLKKSLFKTVKKVHLQISK